jgi:Tol biopolymer transport system component
MVHARQLNDSCLRIVFHSNQGNSQWEIWAQRLFGDHKAFPVAQKPQSLQGTPALSPDGKWLANDSSPDGKWIVYVGPGRGILVEPFPGPGRRIQVSTGAAAQPRWSLDGRQIFFIQPDRKLIALSFDPRAGTAGAPRILFQTRIAAERIANWQYTVAPDGRFLINSLPSNTASPLTLISGWDAALAGR